jgi:hypothetical protein
MMPPRANPSRYDQIPISIGVIIDPPPPELPLLNDTAREIPRAK